MTIVIASALVAATALLASWRLAQESIVRLLVCAYVIAFAEIVVVCLLLSLGSNLTRRALLVSILGAFALAVAIARPWTFARRRGAALALRSALGDKVNAATAILAGGVVLYSIALGLFTPPSANDELRYHLARAAFWRQQHAVGYVQGALDPNLNAFPPNAEIVMAFTMIVSGRGTYAPLVQLVSCVVAAVAVFGVARRIGFDVRASLFGALIFVTLPVVALQASTSLNDVVVAALVACVVFFLLDDSRASLYLAALTVALLVGTKLTGIIALPGLVLVAGLANSRRRLSAVAAVVAGVLAGSYWYVVNAVEAGNVFGGIASQRVGFDPVAAISRTQRMALSFLELPGAVGRDRLFFVGAALLLAVVAAFGSGPWRRRAAWAAVASGAIATMLVLVALDPLFVRASQKAFVLLGRADVGALDPDRSTTKAGPQFSFFGPVGVALGFAALVFVIRDVHRRRLPPVAVALALAPLLWLTVEGILLPYWDFNGGRFTMPGVALAAATWGVVLPWRPLAWSAVAMAAVTVTLSFVHEHDRPSGLRLLEPTHERSVWSEPSWVVEATDHPDQRAVYKFFTLHVPADARISLQPQQAPQLSPYAFFGRDLSRTVVFAGSIAAARRANVQWAVLQNERLPSCVSGWKVALRIPQWTVLRRDRGHQCR